MMECTIIHSIMGGVVVKFHVVLPKLQKHDGFNMTSFNNYQELDAQISNRGRWRVVLVIFNATTTTEIPLSHQNNKWS